MTDQPFVVLKLGGELLESADDLQAIATVIARAGSGTPLVVVHGGGREIDAALAAAGLPKQQVDGLRITDAPTLDIVVHVLAGSVNTRLVAAVVTHGGRGVGLTGADDGIGIVERADLHATSDGCLVDLGLVGQPTSDSRLDLLRDLCRGGYVPIVSCIGLGRDGRLFNVNADVLAAHFAAGLRARRLVIAGGTSGVLDTAGQTIPRLSLDDIDGLVARGTASAGMIAKLRAASTAAGRGVERIVIVNGRNPQALRSAMVISAAPELGRCNDATVIQTQLAIGHSVEHP
ncbi:MAG: acetylglutamate kinase [Acidobacteria bacterium]|nr:acetylglutamate kinase [Acidobacteriota bacterium]MBI3264775.1 acetylglutamate kinase [Acidobacteriota bacterium]